MAKFVIPKTVAEIKIIQSNGNISTEEYQTMDEFYSALVRANVGNKKGTFKQFGETEILEDGKIRVWMSIVNRKDDALSENKE